MWSLELMKTALKLLLLSGFFIYIELFYFKDFNEHLMKQIDFHQVMGQGGDLEDPLEVIEVVRNFSGTNMMNPLRRTFFHFERHTDQYIENWRQIVMKS